VAVEFVACVYIWRHAPDDGKSASRPSNGSRVEVTPRVQLDVPLVAGSAATVSAQAPTASVTRSARTAGELLPDRVRCEIRVTQPGVPLAFHADASATMETDALA